MKNIKIVVVVFSLTSMVLDSSVVEVSNTKALSNIIFAKISDEKKRSIVIDMFISDPALKTTGTGKYAINRLFGNDNDAVKKAEEKAKSVGGSGTAIPPVAAKEIEAVKTATGSKEKPFLDAITAITSQTIKSAYSATGAKKEAVVKAFEAGL